MRARAGHARAGIDADARSKTSHLGEGQHEHGHGVSENGSPERSWAQPGAAERPGGGLRPKSLRKGSLQVGRL